MNMRAVLSIGCIVLASQFLGCGSTGSGSGEIEGSRASQAAMKSGCRTVCPTCEPGVACSDHCRLECPSGVVPCGTAMCRHGEVCCNASCGICTRPGDVCTAQVCAPRDPCVETALCIRGFHWSLEQCACVPDPSPPCTTDADCRLFSDYCTGCDCRVLSTDTADPECAGPGVRCFADPCGGKAAACVHGQCTERRARTRPRAPHRPHAPHQPHTPGDNR